MKRIGGVDEKDLLILEALQSDGRTPLSVLGRQIGLSQPAMSERVRRLEDSGIIEGYGARLNMKALGLGMMAIIRLRTTHDNIKPCLKRFAEIPNIIEVHRVTGEDCFVLKVLVPAPEDLERLVDGIAAFGPVMTSVVLRSEPSRGLDSEFIRTLTRRRYVTEPAAAHRNPGASSSAMKDRPLKGAASLAASAAEKPKRG